MAIRCTLRWALIGLLLALLMGLSACAGATDASSPVNATSGSTERPTRARVLGLGPADDAAYTYRHEPACASGVDALSVHRCTKLNHQCTEAPGGRLVQWYRAPNDKPDGWERHEVGCLYDEAQKGTR